MVLDLQQARAATVAGLQSSARSGGSGSGSGSGSGAGRGGGGGGASPTRKRGEALDSNRTEEKLTDKTIEGVTATGVRRITTIPSGAIGNEQPIRVVSEEWTSPELQVLLLTDLNDPRSGRSTYRLFSISRSNPDLSLFQVPAGYTIVKEPSPDWINKDQPRAKR